MIDADFFRFTLLGNVEGIGVSILTYFLFVKIFPPKNLRGEKPLSFKRSLSGLVLMTFYGLVMYLAILQGPKSASCCGWPIVDLWLFVYCCLSGYLFVFKPTVINAEGG